jgi:hypothetical protein
MAGKPIGERVMTATERQRRWRLKKRRQKLAAKLVKADAEVEAQRQADRAAAAIGRKPLFAPGAAWLG